MKIKTTSILISAVFMLCAVSCSDLSKLKSRPKLEDRKKGTIDESTTIGILNLTVVRIDPNGKKVTVDWKGFNTKSGNAFNVKFERIELKAADEVYVISDQNVGNNALMVNGTLYSFDSGKQQVLIKFGEGVNLEDGGDFRDALNIYDVTSSHFEPKAEPDSGGNSSRRATL